MAPSPKNRSFKDFFRIYGFGLVIAGLTLTVAYQFVEPAPPFHLTIATADKDGAYHAFAKEYQHLLAQKGIELKILETSGSVENLDILKSKKAEAAFIQGGTGSPIAFPTLKGLASLYQEPLWVFTSKKHPVTSITDLHGKRIGIGRSGSGTQKITRQILKDNDISEDTATFLKIGSKEGIKKLQTNEIDALFLVTQAGSPQLQQLMHEQDIQLLSITRAAAYTRHHSFLSYVILPEGGIDLARNIPSRDIHLIAPAATLVINENLHPALIDQLLQVSQTAHRGKSLLLTDTKFPSSELLDFPLSKEAKRYYLHGPPFLQRYLPFWAATLVDRLKVMLLPLIALIIPLIKILPPTYRWRIRSRIYRWYEELHAIDNAAAEANDQESLADCHKRLQKIEVEARQIEVPLSYAKELYTLRHHIELLRCQINSSSETDV